MTKAIEDAANALAIRTALGVPTNAELAAVSDVADAAYVKPVDGIPHNDLHTGIRDQLDLADTALQPGVLPVGTTVTAAQISDAGAAGRTLLQKGTLPEIQSLVSGAGRTQIDASRVDATLTAAEQQALRIVFSGALAADVTFDIGALRKRRTIDAQTSGVGRLLLKFGTSGTAFPVPKNETVEVQ